MTNREQILKITASLFLERGCKSLTMDEVASANGMSKRTLYELFHDKAELLQECILLQHKDNMLRSEEELSRQFARLDSLRIPALEYACIKMHEIEGEPGQVVDGVLEQAQDFDLQNRHMRPLVEAGMAEHRVDLLEVALYYARKSFYSRDLYLEYKESVPNIHKGKLTDSLL